MSLKIEKVTPVVGEYVSVHGGHYPLYLRYSADNWVQMGEFCEPAYDEEELEEAYQEFKKSGGIFPK